MCGMIFSLLDPFPLEQIERVGWWLRVQNDFVGFVIVYHVLERCAIADDGARN